jgi:hypothetical protein
MSCVSNLLSPTGLPKVRCGRPCAANVASPSSRPRRSSSVRLLGEHRGSALARDWRAFADEPLEMLMSDEERLIAALVRAADIAVRQDGAEAVIVGGGPLAAAADRLRRLLSVPVVEPTPTAVRDLQDRCSRGGEGLRAGSASQLRFVMRRRGDAPERTVRVAKRRPRSGTAGNSSSPRSPGPSSVRTATSNARRPM